MNYRPTSSFRRGHRIGLGACAALLMFTATACGGSDDSDASSDGADASSQGADSGSDASGEDGLVVEVIEPPGEYELLLDDGTRFIGNLRCNLEADEDNMIEYSVQDNGELLTFSVVQWAEGNAAGATQEVEIFDTASFDTLWRSVGSTGLVLERNDNVITGAGDFYEGENLNGPYTPGNLTVTC